MNIKSEIKRKSFNKFIQINWTIQTLKYLIKIILFNDARNIITDAFISRFSLN